MNVKFKSYSHVTKSLETAPVNHIIPQYEWNAKPKIPVPRARARTALARDKTDWNQSENFSSSLSLSLSNAESNR